MNKKNTNNECISTTVNLREDQREIIDHLLQNPTNFFILTIQVLVKPLVLYR